MTKVYTFQEFRDNGLLWLINTSVFHPQGYAIAFVYEDEDTEFKNPIGWQLYGDGSEPYWYVNSDETFNNNFSKVQKLFKETNE